MRIVITGNVTQKTKMDTVKRKMHAIGYGPQPTKIDGVDTNSKTGTVSLSNNMKKFLLCKEGSALLAKNLQSKGHVYFPSITTINVAQVKTNLAESAFVACFIPNAIGFSVLQEKTPNC